MAIPFTPWQKKGLGIALKYVTPAFAAAGVGVPLVNDLKLKHNLASAKNMWLSNIPNALGSAAGGFTMGMGGTVVKREVAHGLNVLSESAKRKAFSNIPKYTSESRFAQNSRAFPELTNHKYSSLCTADMLDKLSGVGTLLGKVAKATKPIWASKPGRHATYWGVGVGAPAAAIYGTNKIYRHFVPEEKVNTGKALLAFSSYLSPIAAPVAIAGGGYLGYKMGESLGNAYIDEKYNNNYNQK